LSVAGPSVAMIFVLLSMGAIIAQEPGAHLMNSHDRVLVPCTETRSCEFVRWALNAAADFDRQNLEKDILTFSRSRSEKCDFRIAHIFNGP